ncbi:MAG: DUF4384 domain-containing protein [Mangrovibacterium sp.]
MKSKVIVYLVFLQLSLFIAMNGFAQHGKGLIFDDEAYAKIPKKAELTLKSYASMPAAASVKQYCPEPQNQGPYGTCVGWATAWAARTILYAKVNNITEKNAIIQNAFSPAFVYYFAKGNEFDENCSEGAQYPPALELATKYGITKYSDFSEMCASEIPDEIIEKAGNFKIKGYNRLFDPESDAGEKIRTTKKTLSNALPVLIGLNCPESVSSVTAASNVWIPIESPYVNYGGHALCVVGYDDNKYGGAFEIMNSWGSDWGKGGFFWIRYNDYANFTKNAFEMYPYEKTVENKTDLSGKIVFQVHAGEQLSSKCNSFYAKGQSTVTDEYKSIADYSIGQPLKSGTKYRLLVSNSEPAYVYVISSDLKDNTSVLFPHDKNISPCLNYASNEIAIPGENYSIQLDNNTGYDYTCVLYSKEELDIDSIINKVKTAQGSFDEKVYKAVADKLVAKENIKLLEKEIGFEAKSDGKSVVVLIIAIKHV